MTRAADQRAAAFELFSKKHGVREVARVLGLPKSTVSDWRRQWADQVGEQRPPASSSLGQAVAKARGKVGAAEDRQAARLEPGKRPPAHRHPHDTPRPVIGFDLHRTLTPATGFPLEPPYPGVKEAMDRWAGRGACLHITTAALSHHDSELVAVRTEMTWAWAREHGLPIGAVLPKPHADVYQDDRMVQVPEDPADVDWSAVARDVDAMLDIRFAVGDDGLYFRTDHEAVGDEITDWPELADVPADQPRGFSTPTLYVDYHRTLYQASGSTKSSEPMPGAVEAVRTFYDEGYQIVLGCAGWNPATHDDGDWQHRLAGLIQQAREDGIPYDRIVTVDHNDVRVDDKGHRFSGDWAADTPVLRARLNAPLPPGDFGGDFAETDAAAGCGCCEDCGDDCDGSCCGACQVPPVQNGVMVAFFVPPAAAAELALDPEDDPTAVTPDELHLTLAYLGSVKPGAPFRFPADQAGRLRRVVGGFAAIAPPLAGEVSGVGWFATGDHALYASVDAPQLPAWRQRLIEHLKMAGFQPSELHGFTPHVTLAFPEELHPVDIEPTGWRLDTLSVCIGGDRVDFPLEGTVLTFADRSATREVERPHPDEEEGDRDLQEGQEEAQHAGVDKARDVAHRIGPGEPLPPPTPGTEGMPSQDVVPLDMPPIIDKLRLEAIRRYINLLKNDVPHHRALDAVQHIDPDFTISDHHVHRLFHALGKGDEPVKFGWSAGNVKPPPHVLAVYDQFEMTAEQTNELADYLLSIATESYLDGVNAQLLELGLPVEGALTDPDVLATLKDETSSIAEGIADTYNRDLANEVYTVWVEHRSTLGRQSSQTLLADEVGRWAQQRAHDRAEMIALTEVGRFYNEGVSAFLDHNPDLDFARAYVTPDECVCSACANLVAGNPYTLEEMSGIDLPLHPRCVHLWEVEYESTGQRVTAGSVWAAQAA